jgi:hypothetical protein
MDDEAVRTFIEALYECFARQNGLIVESVTIKLVGESE